MPGAAVPRFDSVTIDCPDPATLARFYGQLLDWPMPEPAGGSTQISGKWA
jgi:glyoxalase superfamily protein